jgi:hypothetical protein
LLLGIGWVGAGAVLIVSSQALQLGFVFELPGGLCEHQSLQGVDVVGQISG